MLARNDLVAYSEPSRIYRVLWVALDGTNVAILEISTPNSLPVIEKKYVLEADIAAGTGCILEEDPYRSVVDENAITDKYKVIRDRAWKIIKPLISAEPQIYFSNTRGKLVSAATKRNSIHHKRIYCYLRRYWTRGQTINALLPDYTNSGGKGKRRKSNDKIKRGRPRKYGTDIGININDEHRRLFKLAIKRYYATKKTFTYRDVYNAMIRDYFCVCSVDHYENRTNCVPKVQGAITGFPSYGQFRYWVTQDHDLLELKRKHLRPRVYDKDFRGILGTSTSETWGPTSRYQIDATIADIYLVSRINRQKIIGRPVLYIVIDIFSRMVVGMYVGLEGPSWVGAMMALANTAEDKKNFCSRNGIEIQPEEWPCKHLPAILLGDRGEIEARSIDTLINNFNVTVENAAAYRADWKGIVEQRFHLIPSKYKPYVPGYVDADYRARGSRDYRLDATLDLAEFTQIIIKCVLYYNNCHFLKQYDKAQDIVADDIPPIPIELWEWGISNRSGCLRTYPEELVRFSLLPIDDAVVTPHGIRLKGLYYTCRKGVEERWFDKARQRGSWKAKASFDPRLLDEIYLHDPESPHHFEICSMTERSRAFRGSSLWEIAQAQSHSKRAYASHVPKQQIAISNLLSDIETIVSHAKARNIDLTGSAKAARTSDIRANRLAEKKLNREAEAFRFDVEENSNNSIRRSDAKDMDMSADYRDPDITEIIETAKGANDKHHR